MKKIVFIISLLLTVSCKNTETQNKSTDCSRTISLNENSICLPLFQGMEECYLKDDIQKIVNHRNGLILVLIFKLTHNYGRLFVHIQCSPHLYRRHVCQV